MRGSGRNVSIIGAGNVGTTLGLLLSKNGYRVVSVVSSRLRSARLLARRVRCRSFSTRLSDISPASHLVLIAVPDAAIRDVARGLAKVSSLDLRGMNIFHTSGVMTSDALRPLVRLGARVGSIHPMQTFTVGISLRRQLESMKGVVYGFEGKKKEFAFVRRLAASLGGQAVRVPKERKILYHLACVFASNYSMALVQAVNELAADFLTGSRFKKLMMTSIERAMERGPERAMTGPAVRGDVGTVRRHVQVLRGRGKSMGRMYRALAEYVIDTAVHNGRLGRGDGRQLRKVLRRISTHP